MKFHSPGFKCFLLTLIALPAIASAETLLRYDFNDTVTWPLTSQKQTEPGVMAGNFGTVDVAGGKEGSGGLLLVMDRGKQPDWGYGKGGYVGPSETGGMEPLVSQPWSAQLNSGPLAVKNTEADLGKLTLSFNLSATRALPVKVLVESFDANQQRTGGLETTIHPAAADFYQRYALDLSAMKPKGAGQFDPAAPFVGFIFETGSVQGWPAATHHEVRLDNVHYASGTFYISLTGNDSNDGRSERTAFATPQKAIDAAQPGDIILVMNGTYSRPAGEPEKTPVARFVRPGTPSGWITLKNFPGHQPVFSSHGQTAINISQSAGESQVLSYIEIRGLHVRGNGDTAREQFPNELGTFSPNVHSQGILINGRTGPDSKPRLPTDMVHHIRLADNVVEFNTADGIYVEFCDWLFVENNRIENNCWTTPGYAPSGFALMGYANFDALDNIHKILIAGNRASGNRLTVKNHPWGENPKSKFYNGNGFLLDANADKSVTYLGRTLVQNNLATNNGAGGIQMWGSHRLDIVNNTIANNASVIPWGQVGFEYCRDVRFINNIVVAPTDLPLDTWFLGRADERTSGIVRINNLYRGGAHPNIAGIGDLRADPLFISADDFHLKSDSPASRTGRWETFSPILDLEGKPRPLDGSPNVGAFQ
jgi:parallel beta-helix repeat protein